jgi:hypothetical protein
MRCRQCGKPILVDIFFGGYKHVFGESFSVSDGTWTQTCVAIPETKSDLINKFNKFVNAET